MSGPEDAPGAGSRGPEPPGARPADADRTRSPERSGRAGDVSAPRAWLLAARPHTLPAAAAPVAVGGGLAAAEGGFALLPFAAALLCALLLQIGANFANDYFDYVHGADSPGREGFTRVTQAGLVPPGRVRRWTAAVLGAALLPGGYLVWVGGWPILAVGLAAIASAVAYTGGPWPLGYHGLGDLFVFLFFGLVAVSGTHYVQTLRFEPGTLVAGAGVGALTTAILVVNNYRDIESDRRAGKHTLAVRLGPTGSRVEYVLLLVVAMAAPAAGVAALGWSPWSLLAWVSVLPLASPLRAVLRGREPEAMNRALSATGRGLAVYALLLAAGLAL